MDKFCWSNSIFLVNFIISWSNLIFIGQTVFLYIFVQDLLSFDQYYNVQLFIFWPRIVKIWPKNDQWKNVIKEIVWENKYQNDIKYHRFILFYFSLHSSWKTEKIGQASIFYWRSMMDNFERWQYLFQLVLVATSVLAKHD